MIVRGNFISIWDEGVITTPATLDTETGKVETNAVEVHGFEHLIEENFEATEDMETYEVCPDCHEYILVGDVCVNPNCE